MSGTSSGAAAASPGTKAPAKRGRKTKQEQTTPDVAIALLQSALSYCQEAGIPIGVGTVQGRLILALDGIQLAGDQLVLIPADAPAAPAETSPPATTNTGNPAPPKRTRRKATTTNTGNLPAPEVTA